MISCNTSKKDEMAEQYKTQCSSCHMLPKINALPKNIWKEGVLPEMAARMGLISEDYDPYRNLTYSEQEARMKTGVYPTKAQISKKDWHQLSEYILTMAPDSLTRAQTPKKSKELTLFKPSFINLDDRQESYVSFLNYKQQDNSLIVADFLGNIKSIDHKKEIEQITTAYSEHPISYIEKEAYSYLTSIGHLNPSEIPRGSLQIENGKERVRLPYILHRPVHTLVEDLNGDGSDEIVVCEFGHLTGAVSLFIFKEEFVYDKKVLLNVPGSIRSIAKDMNGDGRLDIIVLTSQGREGVTIFYQTENLKFKSETVLEFSPVFGSSWFEIVDFNGDGFYDIITAHGDNADNSYVHKPYHGLRIHLNDGHNTFNEKFFYPLNGATRFVAEDFDLDGDIDFAILAAFPDYENNPLMSFVYLQNINILKGSFNTLLLKEGDAGRWLLMEAGDFDHDGDIDLVLSSFSYNFTPIPEKYKELWKTTNTDLLFLDNKTLP